MDFALDDGTVYGTYTGKEWRERRRLSAHLLSGGRSDRIHGNETGAKTPLVETIWRRSQDWCCAPSDLWRFADHSDEPVDLSWANWVGNQHGELCLRSWRDRLGLSQSAVGESAGITRQRVSQLEASTGAIRLATIWRLAKALGVPTGHLWRWA